MKREVNVWDYAGKILEVMDKGILMTTAAGGEQNTMVIGWGHLGIIWGKPTFCAFVRESRHTKKLVDQNREFTINVPLGAIDKILSLYAAPSPAGIWINSRNWVWKPNRASPWLFPASGSCP